MTRTFDQVVDDRIQKIRNTLSKKAGEYATSGNKFHNFDVAGRISDSPPEQALFGMMLKHIVSVMDIVESGITTEAQLDEKIGDTINYLILLEGIMLRKIDEGTAEDPKGEYK